MLSWVDGQPATQLPLTDRGLAYGDGLFETIAIRQGAAPLLPRHLTRLAQGLERLAIKLDLARLEQELMRFAAALGDGVAKLVVTRGDGLRGYAPPVSSSPRCILLGNPRPAYPVVNREQGIELFPCATRLAEQPLLAGLKHLNRLEQVLARAEWQDPRYAEGLLCDYSGRVIEGVFSNLFMLHEGVLHTPDLSRCGVAGVMRAELLAQAEQLGIQCVVSDISLAQLHQADEVFFCNSLYGIWPVRALADRRWPLGVQTRKLQAIIQALLD